MGLRGTSYTEPRRPPRVVSIVRLVKAYYINVKFFFFFTEL